MYLPIGLFAAALLFGIIIRKVTAPKTQSIGLAGPLPVHESNPDL